MNTSKKKKKSKQTKKYLYTISRLERNEPTTESSLYLCSKYVHLVLSVFGLNNYIINWWEQFKWRDADDQDFLQC